MLYKSTNLKISQKFYYINTINTCSSSQGFGFCVSINNFVSGICFLNPLYPFHTHISHFINKTWIAEIHRYFKGRLMLVMDDKDRTTVITSDSYTHTVKSKLGL